MTLADQHYPSGRRELLELCGDGAGAATVRSLRDRLEFVVGGVTVTIPAPLAPTKLSEFAQYLQRNVKPGANPGGLKAELFFPEAADVEDYGLPASLVFSDEGDAEVTEEDHDAKAWSRNFKAVDRGSLRPLPCAEGASVGAVWPAGRNPGGR